MPEKKELALTEEKVVEIETERLESFENHPFKVKADSQMIELQESEKSIGKFEVPKCTTLEELLEEYVRIYGHDKWGVSTYAGNISLINNYILPTIGKVKLSSINTHFMEKYYKDLLEMPAVKSSKIYL